MDVRQGEGGISSKVASQSAIPITDDHRLQHVAPVMGAMDAAGAHSDRRTNFPRRWPCDLHLARALGCGSRFRHTAHRRPPFGAGMGDRDGLGIDNRSEEHTSELQSLMRISYAVFCLKKKNK